MSPTDRCDEVIRLIDSVLDGGDEGSRELADDDAPDDADTDAAEASDDEESVESVPGQWGVYYLRPTA